MRSEARAMPTDDCIRLDDRQRIANFRKQPIEANEYHSEALPATGSDRRDFTDRSAARGAYRGLRAMPKDYTGFQGVPVVNLIRLSGSGESGDAAVR